MSIAEDLERDGFCIERNLYDQMEIGAVFGQINLLGCGLEPALYEGAKQVPALYRLIASPKSMELIQDLRPGYRAGIAEGGIQVRADRPHDEKWRTHWHQDGTFQGRSSGGLTFWTPLVPITPDLGPVEICVGSHKGGLLPIFDAGDVAGVGRSRSYTWELECVDEIVAKYEIAAPLTKPGDVIVMDSRTIHRSGLNVSAVPRWSCLWRYFDFRDKSMGWRRPSTFGPMAA